MRDHKPTQENLPHTFLEFNQVLEIPNAASGKNSEIEALKKIFPVLEDDKITNLKFHAGCIHLDDPKASYQMFQRFKKDRMADLLYSEQPKDLHIFENVNNLPKAT